MLHTHLIRILALRKNYVHEILELFNFERKLETMQKIRKSMIMESLVMPSAVDNYIMQGLRGGPQL
jgi:hypothetical protein